MTRILHLSDTHVAAVGVDMDGVDAIAALDGLLHDLRRVPDLDLVVVSGDVSDDGSEAGCRAVLDRVGAFAAERDIPHVYCAGNHDERGAFARVLGSGHRGADGSDRGVLLAPETGRVAAVSEVDGLRVVTLDSLVPGETPGRLDAAQLSALQATLADAAPDGTLVVLHHPPLEVRALPYVARAGLLDADDLARALGGSDVRVVLCGHLHLQVAGSVSGIPVWVTPGVVTRVDATARPHHVRGVLGASASVVELPAPGAMAGPTFHVLHARGPRAGEQVYVFDADTGEDSVED